MNSALLVMPREVSKFIPMLDRELDRLLDAALTREWSRAEFRAERVEIGRLAAAFLDAARTNIGLDKSDVSSIWTWESDSMKEGDVSAAGASSTAAHSAVRG